MLLDKQKQDFTEQFVECHSVCRCLKRARVELDNQFSKVIVEFSGKNRFSADGRLKRGTDDIVLAGLWVTNAACKNCP